MTLITAPAATTNGYDFFRAVTGQAPLTAADKAAREAERRIACDEAIARHELEMIELRKRLLAQFKTDEGRAKALAEWAAQGVDVTQLTQVQSDPLRALEPRRAA